jgi:4-hydroxybenzoate polyprenyltransferase
MLISRSTLLHLRFPVSYFLLPVYMLALAITKGADPWKAIWIFIIYHLLLFPASNGYNSYYDRDEESIGGLKSPPKITPDLLWVSLALDGIGIVLALFVHPVFALGCLMYGLASKAYSFDKIRIKRLPFSGWLFTGIGQGGIIYLLTAIFLKEPSFALVLDPLVLIPSGLAGIFMLGYYPLTQVYQHREDSKRGDRTISIALGIRGTFFLCIPLLIAAMAGLSLYLSFYFSVFIAGVFVATQLPCALFLASWAISVMKDESKADYSHAMAMNLIGSTSIILFSIILMFIK